MNRRIIFPLFVFLFLFLSTNVLGYEIFNQNPYFDSNYTETLGNLPTGVVLYGSIYNNTWYYNQTCSGLTNCTIIENNGLAQQNSLWIQKYDWYNTNQSPQWTDLTALLSFDDNNAQNGVHYLDTYLPANEEGIIVFNYRWDNTLTTPQPYLSVLDQNGNSVLYVLLNYSPNIWYNVTQYINASTSNRYLNIRFNWYWDNILTRLAMDKFKFYTLDLTSANEDFNGNQDYDATYFCGAGYTNINGASYPLTNWYLLNTTRNNGFFFVNDKEGLGCFAFKVGQQIIVRRLISGNYGILNIFRDPFYFVASSTSSSCGCGNPPDCTYGTCTDAIDSRYLITSFPSTTVEVTLFQNATSNYQNIFYNQTTNPKLTMSNSSDGILKSLSGWNKATMSVYPFLNVTANFGSKWKDCVTGSTSSCSNFYDFFSNSFHCSASTTCNLFTNNQTTQDSNCNITQNVNCGYCGCKVDLTGCNFPTITGTYCDLTDPTLSRMITNHSDCTVTNYQCPSGSKCSQLTPQISPNGELVENFTDCSQWTWWGGCYNLYPSQCYLGGCSNDTMPMWSNCPTVCQPYAIGVLHNYNYPLIKNIYAPNPIPNISIYTAYCVDAYGNEVIAIDQNGNNTTSHNILNNATSGLLTNCTNTTSICYDSECGVIQCPPPTYSTNAFGTASLLFGSLFGMGDVSSLPSSEAGFSILLSLLAGLGIMVYEHDKSDHGGTFANISFLAVFLLCAIMSANVILYGLFAVVVIIDVGMITGMLKKLIGGG